jgi:hypothetical protein
MEWTVLLADEFEAEFLASPREVQDETLASARLLQHFGPQLGVHGWIRSAARGTPI